MNEAWDVQDSGCVSLWGLWAWGLSFGYALSDALLRIVLWGNASPTSWRKETWPVLVLAAAAAAQLGDAVIGAAHRMLGMVVFPLASAVLHLAGATYLL